MSGIIIQYVIGTAATVSGIIIANDIGKIVFKIKKLFLSKKKKNKNALEECEKNRGVDMVKCKILGCDGKQLYFDVSQDGKYYIYKCEKCKKEQLVLIEEVKRMYFNKWN
jgi:hypothetical protein